MPAEDTYISQHAAGHALHGLSKIVFSATLSCDLKVQQRSLNLYPWQPRIYINQDQERVTGAQDTSGINSAKGSQDQSRNPDLPNLGWRERSDSDNNGPSVEIAIESENADKCQWVYLGWGDNVKEGFNLLVLIAPVHWKGSNWKFPLACNRDATSRSDHKKSPPAPSSAPTKTMTQSLPTPGSISGGTPTGLTEILIY